MRRNSTVHARQKATLEISTAKAAPVAPHFAPSTPTSGTSRTISSPCVQMRRPGRPIETGNDFVQPNTMRIAPATITIRVASTAPAFFAEKSSFASSCVKTSSGTRITALTAAIPAM